MADPVISDGLYWIVSADDASMAMDVRGASDLSGTEVQYYGRNRTDAQLVSVRNRTQDGQSGLMLTFPLCGRVADVVDGGTVPISNGTRVRTWDGSGSRAQLFQPVSQGRTVTVDGESRQVYKLRSLALRASGDSKNYCLDGSGTSTSSGTVIWLWEEYSGGKQSWVFVPVSTPALGTYRIRTAVDPTLCMDVYGNSTQAGANVQLFSERDQNNQRFVLVDMGEGLVGLRNAESGLMVDCYGDESQARSGQNVWMYALDGDPTARGGQSFALIPSGQASVGGVTADCYEIAPKDGSLLRLDAAGGGDSPEDNVQVFDRNGSTFQKWILSPDEAEATDVPAPSSVGLADASGVSVGASLGVRSATALRPRWTSSGNKWKHRLRRRLRPAGGEWGEWSDWAGLRDGSAANGGWGDMGTPSEVTTASGDVTSALPIECPVDGTAYDGCQVGFEVRRFLDDWRGGVAHTASGSCTSTVTWMPSISLTSVGFGPSGLTVGYETDSRRDGHSAVVSSDLFDEVRVERMPRSGAFVVPMSSLRSLPTDGQAVSMTVRLTSCDGCTATYDLAGTVSYDAGSGMSLLPSYRLDPERRCWDVMCPQADSCWLLVPDALGGARFEECPRASDGRWRAIPPFGQPAHVFLTGSSGSSWAVRDDVLDPIDDARYAWSFGEGAGSFLAVSLGLNDPPSVSHSLSADSEAHLTTGRDFPVVGFGRTVRARCDVSGVLRRDLADAVAAARSLAASGRTGEQVVFRDPWGFRARVAVTAVDLPRKHPGYVEVDVTQEVAG